MGIKERRERERDAFRKLIVATAHELLKKEGLEGVTMRAIAQKIEYSQSKIYEFFKSKDQLYEVLCNDYCEQLLDIVKKIPKDLNPDEYLTQLVFKCVEFHVAFPHSDQLFTLVCFGPQRFKVPQAYSEMELFPINAVRNLKSPYIKNKEEILIALDIIRCFKIGISVLMTSAETSIEGKNRAYMVTENVMKVLLRGWREVENVL